MIDEPHVNVAAGLHCGRRRGGPPLRRRRRARMDRAKMLAAWSDRARSASRGRDAARGRSRYACRLRTGNRTIYARRGPTSPRWDKRVTSSTEPAPATHPVSWSTSTRAAALTVWPHRRVATPADAAVCRERGHIIVWHRPRPATQRGFAPWPALSCAARSRGLALSTVDRVATSACGHPQRPSGAPREPDLPRRAGPHHRVDPPWPRDIAGIRALSRALMRRAGAWSGTHLQTHENVAHHAQDNRCL